MLPFPSRSLVVSCQATASSPLRDPDPMARMARAAEEGGAVAIRANGPADVAAIARAVAIPIIGINKTGDPRGVYITPTADAAGEVVAAGARLVAVDGTTRPRPDGATLAEQIARIHDEYGVPVMADVDHHEAGLAAREAGADIVATTLSGYTGPGPVPEGPDLELVASLVAALDCPVIAEGRYWTPEQAREAVEAGAYAVVVGTAITNPGALTGRFRRALS
ncbi:putative N-acetylmannosamine-6-phosphate 2-epimerase [Sphaerisporangium krabiense]|uniref:Putative N-acetylmannosamine-6-phosphate 2-epimerase n=1 Tax=Sphaerisporangium krabiense TaxID=763782 RepID=A0A7W8Z2G4_9ACTN|nr:N-acetylmannosamine-6-phosphate 2-epimerase [Sphaerisporangium krabiense]MBB5626186.1 putative N-acetylmannosamine-6-phosphate epimerase [Sphaerisporangium krabiense]GII66147.1 putative N-acetylmannosamine-6-phosphate 2-epimerase [Sphaerisporangium krabiense]